MKRWAFAALLSFASLWLCGCDGDPLLPEPPDCSPDGQKSFVQTILSSIYLWADKTPQHLDLSKLNTPQEVLEAMAYRPAVGGFDKWSSIVDLAPYVAYFQRGEAVAFGYSTAFTSQGELRVTWVVKSSPAGAAGLTRGATILEIGGRSIADIVHNNLWQEVLGPNEKGASVVHRIRKLDGTVTDLTISKDVVEFDRVPVVKVIPTESGKVGYLLYMGFVAPSEADLRMAFDQLRTEHVDSLVVDLRYNGGGYVYLAGILGSLIAGPAFEGKALLRNTYNSTWSQYDSEMKLTAEPQAVGVRKVVFLTSDQTASASELLINGLEPFLDVKLVGDRTYGKPVGADVWQQCNLAITVITFRSLNALDHGDYFDGLPVDCEQPDDLDRQLGDPEEGRLRQALMLLNNGACLPHRDLTRPPTITIDIARAREQLEKLRPAEMNSMQ
ncbi:MAG TPA: S41 family peptidase [Polyangiaceae bacterium]|nr:S41 family peptidase [Polyangiaceae bacterium]